MTCVPAGWFFVLFAQGVSRGVVLACPRLCPMWFVVGCLVLIVWPLPRMWAFDLFGCYIWCNACLGCGLYWFVCAVYQVVFFRVVAPCLYF